MIWFPVLCVLVGITEESYIYSGQPVPKAELLDEVLAKYMNQTDYTGSLLRYLEGGEDFGDPDNLDVGILDADNIFKIIGNTKKKYQGWFRRTREEAIEKNPYLVNKALNFMKQSIYATRYRLQDTERFRKKFSTNIRYNIAIFYGALMQIYHKMETLLTIMKKLPVRTTHFIWYLICYEKVLAAHVDTHMMVERIYDLHNKHKKLSQGINVVIAPTLPPLKTTAGKKKRGPRNGETNIKDILRSQTDVTNDTNTEDLFDATSGKSTTEPNKETKEERDEKSMESIPKINTTLQDMYQSTKK